MLDKDSHENLLKEIAATGGDTPAMLELMQKLRDDFDEREGMLRKDGEDRDSERPEGEEKEEIVDESKRDNSEDGGLRRDPLPSDMVSRADYDDLRKKYIERFFSNPEEVKREQEEDVKRDGNNQSFDDLFKKREG